MRRLTTTPTSIVIVLSNVTACQCPCNLKLHRESQSSSTVRSTAKNLLITMWWAHCTDGPGPLNMRLQPCRRESRTEACTKLLSDAVTQLTIQRYNSKGQAQSIEAKQIKLSYVTRWQVPCRRLLQEEPSAANNDTAPEYASASLEASSSKTQWALPQGSQCWSERGLRKMHSQSNGPDAAIQKRSGATFTMLSTRVRRKKKQQRLHVVHGGLRRRNARLLRQT